MKFDNTFSECINECKYKARVQNCPGITISTFQISPGQCYGQGQGQGQGGWGGWGGRVGIGYVGWGGWGGQVVVVIGLVGVVGVQWLWWSWCRSVKKWLESHCVLKFQSQGRHEAARAAKTFLAINSML